MRPEPNDRPMDEEDKELVIKAVAKKLANMGEADMSGLLEMLVEERMDPAWEDLKADWTRELKWALQEEGKTSPEEFNQARVERWAEEMYNLKTDQERKSLREQVERIQPEDMASELDLGF